MKKMGWLGLLSAACILVPSWSFGANGEVRKLDFSPSREKSAFTVFFQGKGAFRVFQSEKQGSVVVEADNMLLPARLTKMMDSAGTDGPVVQVTPYAAGDAKHPVAKFVIQLKEEVELVSNEVPGKFSLELKAKKTAQGKGEKKKVVPTLAKKGWSEFDSIKSRKSASEKGEEVAKRLIEVLNSPPEDKVFFGSRVTFEGSQVDVHDIFRLIGEASELNIMTDADIKYKADFSVSGIPWDQLLDIVLDQAQLKAKAVGNVVRIVTAARFAKEQEAKLRELDIADENEPVIVSIVPLSFAAAEDVKTMVEALLVKRDSSYDSKQNDPKDPQGYVLNNASPVAATAAGSVVGNASQSLATVASSAKKVKLGQDFVRGKIEVDSRSNSLVVTNTRRAIERIKRLVKELDVALPQILIDAKIIIASENFTRSLGVSWGGRATSGGSGRAGVGAVFGSSVTLGDASNAAAFTVSEAASKGALGFQLGAGRHGNLSAQLNMAEANGLSKTVAAPRVVVNNKKTAEIVDGQTLFFATVPGPNSPGTLTEKQAALKLNVTPQVTSVGSVLLDLEVSKDAPSTTGTTQAIDTKQIKTQVMVDSGSTLVLGGVYQNESSKSRDGIPLLMDLPFIGSLFRTEIDFSKRSELMVFITPEVLAVKGASEDGDL